MALDNTYKRASKQCVEASTRVKPLHQLVDMPATNDECTFQQLAKYFARFLTTFGIL